MTACINCGRQAGDEKFCADCGTAVTPIAPSDAAGNGVVSSAEDYSPYRLPPSYGPIRPSTPAGPANVAAPSAGNHTTGGSSGQSAAEPDPETAIPAAGASVARAPGVERDPVRTAGPATTPATEELNASPTPRKRQASPSSRGALIAAFVAVLLVATAAVATAFLQPDDTSAPTARDTSGADSVDRPRPTRTTTRPTRTVAPEPTALTPDAALRLSPADAVRELNDLVATDRATVARFTGSWVPQVSSKCVGLKVDMEPNFTPDGIAETSSVTAPQILAFHTAMAERYGVMVTTAADLGSATLPPVCTADALWVSLVPDDFSSADGALRWCQERAIPRDECAARYLAPPGQDTKVELQPQ